MLKAVLFLIFVIFWLAKSQTTERLRNRNTEANRIINLQRHVLHLLNEYRLHTTLNFEIRPLMSESLFAQVNEFFNVLHGWAINKEQSNQWIGWVQNFFRLLGLSYFVSSVQESSSHYMLIAQRSKYERDEMFSLYRQIGQLYSLCYANFNAFLNPGNHILWFEIACFLRLPIAVLQLNGPPWFHLYLRDFSEIRFLNYPRTDGPKALTPQQNYVREMKLLVQAQRTVLKWCREMINTRCVTDNLFSHIDRRLITDLQNSAAYNFVSITGGIAQWDQHTNLQFVQIINVILMHEFINFVRREYDRHLCHPAHAIERHYSSAEGNWYVTHAFMNNNELNRLLEQLLAMLNTFLRQSALLSAAFIPLIRQFYHPGYANTLDGVRMGYACAYDFSAYSSEDFMVSTTQKIAF